MSERRVALVTGGARGLGRGIGLDMASRGWDVAFTYRSSDAAASETQAALRDAGAAAVAVRADVSDPGACEELVRRVERELGAIEAIVHAAGPYHRVPLLEETVEGWRAMFEGNLHPVFYLSRLVVPRMQQRRFGRMLTFSMAGADKLSARPGVTAHAAAKSALLVLTRSLARTLAPHGITVNCISPGFVDTGRLGEWERAAVDRIPAGYAGEVRDVVAVARFLLSEEARYVTGANVVVSGGWGI